jgi:hypothetical protein
VIIHEGNPPLVLQPSAQDAGLALVDATDMHSASEAINGSVPDATVVKKAGYDKYIYIYKYYKMRCALKR